jgi:hypothetical protein
LEQGTDAHEFVSFAREKSKSRDMSPFVLAFNKFYGRDEIGGKPDDITVVITELTTPSKL